MDGGKVRLRTYRQVWIQEQVIYQVERVRLPFPVTLTQLLCFGAGVVVMVILGQVLPLGRIPWLVRFVAAPAALAWFLTQHRLDGKPPHRWLLSWVLFLLGPKRLNRLRSLTPGGRVRFSGKIEARSRG